MLGSCPLSSAPPLPPLWRYPLSPVPTASGPTERSAARAALHAIGLTADQRLVEFDVDRPGRTSDLGRLSGLPGDMKIAGIAFHLLTGAARDLGAFPKNRQVTDIALPLEQH